RGRARGRLMRILHLAYEDPRRPGGGGGSVRTLEVDRRLARRHDVTAVVAAYPGAREQTSDGIRWLPIGPRRAGRLPQLAWFALAGLEARRQDADIVIEDFGAPFSVAMSPLLTDRPVVACVQWLFAREMRAKYGLPFDAVESLGLRAYDDFVVVSDWLAGAVRRRRPEARVETIPNGVPASAFTVPRADPEHLLFLGRLDRAQKGLDLLATIATELRDRLGSRMPPLLVAGDGSDRRWFEEVVQERGLRDIVRMEGRVGGERKARLLSAAHAVIMPSRFETFGMVAAEAEAAAVPLVAFDIGPLRDVAGPPAILVEPFRTDRFADEVATYVRDPRRRDEAGDAGRAWARRYDWDAIADAVEAHLERSLEAWRLRRERREATGTAAR
ncbi:MAG TPA: glycosyltransferase family 4 protein, partial [Candidatus Dormibacteraeota bacterium]|nr:glycosyltransferase family 4 protein [Candidatus Dormibacteraeota bacterium]